MLKPLSVFFFVILITSVSAQSEEESKIQELFSAPTDSLQILSSQLDVLSDTLDPELSIYVNSLDSIKRKLYYRIDSLNKLQLTSERYNRLLDSLNQLEAVKTLKEAENRAAVIQSKVDVIDGKINQPIHSLEQKMNEKINLMKIEGGEGANLPGNVNLPGLDSPNIPELEGSMPSTDLGLPGAQRDLLNPEDRQGLPGLPDASTDIPGLDQLSQVQKDIGEISKVTGELASYGEDLKSIGSGNLGDVKQLPETVEAEAIKIADTGEIQEQAQVVDQYKDIIASGNDPEALKRKALQQVPKLAANHFKGKEEVLQQAIDKVNSYKSKYTELTDLENIPKRQPNEMKGKPFIERLVPAITLQIQNSTDFWLDYNLAIGYRLTRRFTTGLGWNERVGITNKIGFSFKDRVYGPRSFLDYKLKRGFAFRADIEKMNAFIPPYAFGPSDFGSRQWKWGIFMGIKKEYDFIKSVRGNFQFLYNVYDDKGQSPYLSRLVVRFGFEFPMKKKVIDQ